MQDRVIAEARACSSAPCRGFIRLAKAVRLHRARRLGFCKQAVSGTETVLGTIHFTKICATGRATSRNPKMHRLAHVSSHVFYAAEKRGYGIQSDAGTVAAFDSAINLGCLHPGNHACETCSSGSGLVLGVFTRREWSVTIVVYRCCSVRDSTPKGTQKRARKRALLGPQWFHRNQCNSFGMNGGDDETRTRDLCRDSAAGLGFTTT